MSARLADRGVRWVPIGETNLTGLRFGDVTVLGVAKRTRNGFVWHCRIDAGGNAYLDKTQLQARLLVKPVCK